MTTFLVLYRGSSVATAELVAASSDPELVGDFAARLLGQQLDRLADDPILAAKHDGRRRALHLIRTEAEVGQAGADGER